MSSGARRLTLYLDGMGIHRVAFSRLIDAELASLMSWEAGLSIPDMKTILNIEDITQGWVKAEHWLKEGK